MGKICGAKPEEPISKKKNRHEVTDLIKKQTNTCETESMAEGKARTISRKVNSAGFCKGMEMMGYIPIALWLEQNEDSSSAYTGPLDMKTHLLPGTGLHHEALEHNICSWSWRSPRTQKKKQIQEFELMG